MPLDDFLEDGSQETATETMTEESQDKADATQGEAAVVKDANQEDVKGDKADKADKAAPPAEGKKEEARVDRKVPLSVAIDERRKRQEAERELERLKTQGNQPKDQTKEQEKKDFFENPDEAVEQKVAAKVQEVEQRFQAQIAESQAKIRLDISEEMMRKGDADYDRKREMFLQVADTDPNMVRAMMASENPAQWIVEFAEAYELHSSLKDVRSVKSLKDQVRAEILKELEAEGKLAPTAQNGRQVPETITKTPSAAPAGKLPPESEEPDDFDDILGRKKK